MGPSHPPTPPDEPTDLAATVQRTLRTARVAVAVVVATLIAVAASAALTDRTPVEDATAVAAETMVEVAPGGLLAPTELPPAVAAHYQAAQDHMEVFEAVPCFCGCKEMLSHRHLGDCFVRADGSGLEAHALGCGVCLGEAQQVMDLLAADVDDPDRIREAVVAEWGDPYTDR